MLQQELLDKRYQGKIDQLQLFIHLSKQQLSVARFDEAEKKYVGFSNHTLGEQRDWITAQKKIEKVFIGESFQSFKSCRIAINDSLYTLVPLALFDENKIDTYLSFNHSIEDTSQLRFYFDKIESLSLVVAYAIPRGLDFLAKAKLPSFQWNHFASSLLEALHLEKQGPNQLNIHIQEEKFDLLFAPEGKLTFLNSFNYETPEDLLYYLLYAMEQLQLERDNMTLNVWGKMDKNSPTFELLYQYIQEVKLGNLPLGINFSPVLSTIPKHYFFNLFNQHLCE